MHTFFLFCSSETTKGKKKNEMMSPLYLQRILHWWERIISSFTIKWQLQTHSWQRFSNSLKLV